MTIPKHLMEAKLCNKETCEEIRTLKEENQRLKEELEKKNKKYWQSKCFEYQVENRRLKERIEYLERSNNRREDTIISLRDELTEQKDYKNILNELEKWLKEKQKFYGINQQGFSWGVAGDCLNYLKELKESDK